MIVGVHHIGLSVADIAATADGFGAGIALESVAQFEAQDTPEIHALFELQGVSAKVALLRGPNAFLEVFAFDAPTPPAPALRGPHEAGITHVCLQTGAGQSLIDALGPAGFDFVAPLTSLGGDFRYAYGRTREHLMIEVEDAAYPPRAPDVWLGHVAFATPDLERLSGFYASLVGREANFSPRLVGLRAVDRVTGLENVDVRAAWVHGLNLGLEFWCYTEPATVARADRRPLHEPGYSHVCFETDDIAADFDRARALGAVAHAPPQQLRGATAAYLRDPDGNIVELLQWASADARLSIRNVPHFDVLKRAEEAREAAHAKQKGAA
jgi:catechol 2,3-dioxygenase-like lactoylglutathione lyase family enzyme